MVNWCKNFLLRFNMVYLFQFNDGWLFETFECEWFNRVSIIPMLDKSYTSKCSCSESLKDLEIVEVVLSSLFALDSILFLFFSFIVVDYYELLHLVDRLTFRIVDLISFEFLNFLFFGWSLHDSSFQFCLLLFEREWHAWRVIVSITVYRDGFIVILFAVHPVVVPI